MWRALMMMGALVSPAVADDFFSGHPAFSPAETPPAKSAQCEEIRAMAEDVPRDGDRVDLSVTGKLTLVKTDGALWYLVVCSDLRVMCVAYQSNDMKVGDRVEMRGAYRRLDPNHAVLDPCLATAEPE
ncbi:MAG: hypothetical protein KIT48_01805 [Pseudolabrys sp.]|nr:hypothetical protein [Pseudolabrys sp.]